jgi:peroxiredoxin
MTPPRPSGRPGPRSPTVGGGRDRPSRGVTLAIAAAVAVVIVVLYVVFRSASPDAAAPGGGTRFQVGTPGPGQSAPSFTLPAAGGSSTSLADYRGKTVLLYFHEGLGCQPCWDQLRDLERTDALRPAGVDNLVAITTGPADLLAQKLRDDGLRTPTLADTTLAVSRAYSANNYGMMGTGADGHTFILVGPDGTIRWRADYGGAPNYTMYVPPTQLLADLQAGRTP